MNDPLNDRISHALRAEATSTPDPAAAHAEFLMRRRRRQRQLMTGAAAAGAVVVIAGLLAFAHLRQPGSTVAVAGHSSTSIANDQPVAGVPGADTSTSTTSDVPPGPPASTIKGSTATGTPTGPTPTTPPRTTPTTAPAVGPGPPPPGTAVVNEADNGKSYTVVRGQHLEVQLSNDNVWTEPDTSNAAVATRTSGSTNSDGSAQAVFVAAGDGQAIVSADGRSHPLPCETATPRCMVPDHIVHFQVTVNVVG